VAAAAKALMACDATYGTCGTREAYSSNTCSPRQNFNGDGTKFLGTKELIRVTITGTIDNYCRIKMNWDQRWTKIHFICFSFSRDSLCALEASGFLKVASCIARVQTENSSLLSVSFRHHKISKGQCRSCPVPDLRGKRVSCLVFSHCIWKSRE